MESNVEILHFSAHDKVGGSSYSRAQKCGVGVWLGKHAGSFPGVTRFNKIGHL